MIYLAITTSPHAATMQPHFDGLMFFGFVGMFVTLVAFTYRHRTGAKAILPFCLASLSVYAFMQGAWPLGIVEGAWAIAAVHKFASARKPQAQSISQSASQSIAPRLRPIFDPSQHQN